MTMEEKLNLALKASIKASKEVLRQYKEGFEVKYKEDKSPVTSADLLANDIFIKHLQTTSLPILSEESPKGNLEERKKWKEFWCIDPIDGTMEFVDKTDEYCLSLGLLTQETSLLGVLSAPSLGLFYFAAEGIGSYKWKASFEELFNLPDQENVLNLILKNSEKLSHPASKLQEYTYIRSKFNRNAKDQKYFLSLEEKYPNLKVIKMGSVVKLGLVAEGKVNDYTRLSSVNFWDVAAGHAIVKYAGLELNDYYTHKEVNYKDLENLKVDNYTVINL